MPRLLQPTDKWAVFDLETDGLYDEATKVHCIVVRFPDGSVRRYFDDLGVEGSNGTINNGLTILQTFDKLVAHNGIGFDFPVIKKLYNVDIPLDRLVDTIVISRLLWPERAPFDFAINKRGGMPGKLIGSHSLEAWGYRLGVLKGEFAKRDDWSTFSRAMLDYCEQDTAVTLALAQHLLAQGLKEDSVDLEHRFAAALEQQARTGFAFDVPAARELAATLIGERADLMQRLGSAFPPFTDHYVTPKRQEKKTRTVPFNPTSRPHIARAFGERYGWKPTEFTDSGQVRVDDDVLRALPYPEAKGLARMFTITKRLGQLAEGPKSWLENVRKDGRIPARAIHNGAITGRCTHKIVVNVPKPNVLYGETFRSLFVAPAGRVLVGVDAKGLELRGLAHFLFPFDGGAYAEIVATGDPHERNRAALGLETRDQAKTFIYALIYGARDGKLGSVVGGGKKEGAELRSRFQSQLGGYKKLLAHIEDTLLKRGMAYETEWHGKRYVKLRQGAFLRGLDGRRLYLRDMYAALNTIIQGAGAVLMKKATVLADQAIHEGRLDALQVCHQHDEIQMETSPHEAEAVGKVVANAVVQAGLAFQFCCPLAADVKIGVNWKETH